MVPPCRTPEPRVAVGVRPASAKRSRGGTALAALALALAYASSTAEAATVLTSDFEGGLPSEFSGAGVLTGTQGYSGYGFGATYLRNDTSGNPANPTTLSLSGLASHTGVEITFDLAIIDSWDGNVGGVGPDFFNVKVDGASALSETFSTFNLGDQSYAGVPTVFGLNLAQSSWADAAYRITLSVPHTGGTLSLDWFASGSGWQAGADESWAIDNLKVDITGSSGVPDAGATFGLLAFGLAGVLGAARRRSV